MVKRIRSGEPPVLAPTPAVSKKGPLEKLPAQSEPSSAGGPRFLLKGGTTATGPLLDPTRLPTTPVYAAVEAARVGRWNREGAVLVTASSVESLVRSGDLSSLSPPIPKPLWSMATQLLQTLEDGGALGSHGALSARGPLGRHAWNPSFWTQVFGDWRGTSETLAQKGGPGSENGSLGKEGPLENRAMLERLGPLAEQLEAGGLFGALGPLGPLGALAALGHLGLVGGHGYRANERGDFVDEGGDVVRKTDVIAESGSKKSFDLFEMYTVDRAREMKDNDTSWMVRGVLGDADADGHTFSFTSGSDQFVTLTVTPENAGERFQIELLDDRGQVVATSDSTRLVNWIQLQADEARKLKVRVRPLPSEDGGAHGAHPVTSFIDAMLFPIMAWGEAAAPWLRAGGHQVDRLEAGAYRLSVLGGTEQHAETKIQGEHQSRFCWLPAEHPAHG